LFRVRLARMRLAAPTPRAVVVEESFKHGIGWPLAAFGLALVGALAFVGGATLQLWPIWVAGLVAVCGAVVAYRP
jgi:Flp pilus assembly protein TadB